MLIHLKLDEINKCNNFQISNRNYFLTMYCILILSWSLSLLSLTFNISNFTLFHTPLELPLLPFVYNQTSNRNYEYLKSCIPLFLSLFLRNRSHSELYISINIYNHIIDCIISQYRYKRDNIIRFK